MSYTVLIPFYRGDEYRERSIKKVIRHCWEASGGLCRIVISEQNTDSRTMVQTLRYEGIPVERTRSAYSGGFNKSRAWNDGIRFIASDERDGIVLLLDCDILVEKDLLSPEYVTKKMESCRVWHPFDTITDMDRFDSHIVCTEENALETAESRIAHYRDKSRSGLRCYGGALFIRLSDYVLVGGYDNNFDAWGHEDDVFYYACRRRFRTGLCVRSNATVYHIYHPHQNTLDYLRSPKYRQLAMLRIESVRKQKQDMESYSKSMRFGNALFGIKFNR